VSRHETDDRNGRAGSPAPLETAGRSERPASTRLPGSGGATPAGTSLGTENGGHSVENGGHGAPRAERDAEHDAEHGAEHDADESFVHDAVSTGKEWLLRVDHVQREHSFLALPFGVVKKFGDDRAGNLAALIAYYGFFSLFPLLLAFVSILGFVLSGHDSLRRKIQDSALSQFPVLGSQNLDKLGGSGVALAIGVIGLIWAGLGAMQATENAMNEVWDVPIK
jgi:hypothetical protein